MDDHPVRITIDDDLRRSRLTVFFRLLLVIPHVVWLYLWGFAVQVAVIVGWIAALVLGRLPRPLHRFSAAYVSYASQVHAYLLLIANPFPGFVGAAYPLQIVIDPPAHQNRLVTLFRIVLAVPAFLIAGVLGYLLYLISFLGWFAALATGRMPPGFRDAGAAAIRYTAQTYAYTLLLTSQYPHSSPALPARPEPEPEREPFLPPTPEPGAAA